MTVIVVALVLVAGLLLTAVAGGAMAKRQGATPAIYGASLAFSAGLLALGLWRLLAGETAGEGVTLPLGIPWIGAHFRIDALSAFFLVVINLGGAVTSLYAIGYGRHEPSPERVLPFYPAFLAGMNIVLLADDAFTFLVGWEFMSLASWALVIAHHREPDNLRAGYVYILMASAGMMALLLAFGILAGSAGGYAFASIRTADLSPAFAALAAGLALAGAGSKAGLVPLHVWLPLAHPAAPSHVSALMSGVMTKVAVYAFIRIVFDLIGEPAWWWSVPILAIGGVTAVLGVLYATMQDDTKRVLAYSTIENIGVVFVGLGLALAFGANGLAAAAALAMTAALFHAFNHSLFKGLLFFGAGAVLTATGERRLDALGGLIGRMPQTSALVLLGCAAIAALPPFNGFVSEWLMFQAILLSPDLPEWALKLSVPAVGALLALAAALAAACFVRLYGVAFLGRPRSPQAAEATEVDRVMLAAMAILAALCLAAGLLPGLVIDALAATVRGLVGSRMPVQTAMPWLSIVPIAESRSSYNGLLVFVFIAASASIAAFAIHRLASHALRRSPAWDCGFPDPSPATEYGASSFAQPVRRVFATVIGVRERLDMPAPGDVRAGHFSVTVRDRVWDALYAPIADGIGAVADRLNLFQFLTIRRYLSLVFVALVALLLVLAVWE
ncbi:MAG TPA: hydrogenase 4 subunit B [Bauldia sp.]|nr:hydrogenase 4 subunit B [Bauldia sp.]